MKSLKKHFISGIVFIIPVSLSLWILFKIISFLENVLGPLLKRFFPNIYTPGVGFFSLILLILLIGFLTDNFLGRKFLAFFEKMFETMPVLNRIYTFIKSISNNLIYGKSTIFKEVVKISLPNGSYTIGFITGRAKEPGMLNVFIPTVPNISTGFYLVVPEETTERIDISVEEALKTVISIGLFSSGENGTNKNTGGSSKKT
ncbi:MAG: DUF502 domain-containing protein [Candidatus Omnitrophica bacterium]|nr:DUF502 domain-containing protein [Candidatus Omnitrophota bacterium]